MPGSPSSSLPPSRSSASAGRRIGWLLLAAYAVIWGLFLALNIGAPQILSRSTLTFPGSASGEGGRVLSLNGLNFGVVAGMGMLLMTLLFAWIYVRMGRRGAG